MSESSDTGAVMQQRMSVSRGVGRAARSALSALLALVPTLLAPALLPGFAVACVDAPDGGGEGTGEGEDEGEGEGEALPGFRANPARCDFGVVGIGDTAFCDLSLDNVGQTEVVITDLGFSADTPSPQVFGAQGSFSLPTAIPGGAGIALRLFARPQTTGLSTGELFIEALSGARVAVPLQVLGSDERHCRARVSGVNGVAVAVGDDAPVLHVGDNVELSADQSSSSRPDTTISSLSWSLLQRPADSAAVLTTAEGQTTGLDGLDVVGDWVVGLTTRDDLGTTTACALELTTVPPAVGLFLLLSWDDLAADQSLHLTRDATPTWCGVDDCFVGGPACGWGPVVTDGAGFGPHRINASSVDDGRYTVGVGDRAGVASTATVKLFIDGQLEFEGFKPVAAAGQWLPLRVDVVDGVATVTTLDDTSAQPGSCW